MWYAVWVRTGCEDRLLQLCQSRFMDPQEQEKPVIEECFIPRYERAWKENGKWGRKQEILFPGYLFMVSKHPKELTKALKEIPEFAKVLGDEEGPIPLYEQEVEFLRKYTNQDYVMEMSVGVLVGEQLVVTEGPLKDYQGKVVHIDRHKRMVTLEVEFFGRTVNLKVGLEVIRKILCHK